MVRAMKRGGQGSPDKGNVSMEEYEAIKTEELLAELQEARDQLEAQAETTRALE
jgi:hypothetical protein